MTNTASRLRVECLVVVLITCISFWTECSHAQDTTEPLRGKLLEGAREYQRPFQKGSIEVEGILISEHETIENVRIPAPPPNIGQYKIRFMAKYDDVRFYVWHENDLRGRRRAVETCWNGSICRNVYYHGKKPVSATQACVAPKYRVLTEDKYLALRIAFGYYDGDKQGLMQQDATWLQDVLQNAQTIASEPGLPNAYRVTYSTPQAIFTAIVSDKPVVHCVKYLREVAHKDGKLTRQQCLINYGQHGQYWMPTNAQRTVSYVRGETTEIAVTDRVTYSRLALKLEIPDSEFLMPIPQGVPFKDFCKDPVPAFSWRPAASNGTVALLSRSGVPAVPHTIPEEHMGPPAYR